MPTMSAAPTLATEPLDEPVFVTAPERDTATRLRHAIADLRASLALWRLGTTLAWTDIKGRYRGSILGPFWVTASTAVMIAALGILYAALFGQSLTDYLPFLTLSLVLWGYLSTVTTEACSCFSGAESAIRARRTPFLLLVGRIVLRNVIVLGHNVLVVVVVFALFGVHPGLTALWCLPGLVLWLLDSIAITVLLGTLGARFRDIPPIVGSLLQIAFFISPVIWKPELIPHAKTWMRFNPFYSLLDVIREPLLDHAVPPVVWGLACVYSALLCLGAAALFLRVRCRLAYWV
ncbi:lipopolysaccharide transport system permease protein [Endobacter medicaginis]|uniref:ABC transporter permease n=2 Tax=Endobacter medicaginis TaxID=1181271 RepID=A0A850NVW0_9PROT|nr:lipopolysaccharide transport system permease protein [Endobacter medicaginis]NVN30117.1 ABC transporter permease [Endobacter medicaginis]